MLTRKVRPTRSRRARPGLRLKKAILDATRGICFAEGVEGVSTRKIAREVGCSATAIYLYYRSLDDVLHHLRVEGHDRLGEYFRAVDASLPPLERLRALGRAYYRFGVENPKYYELMFLSRFTETLTREFVQREIATLLFVRDAVKDAMDRGAIRRGVDPMMVANTLWSQIHGLTALAISGLLLLTAPGQEAELLDDLLDSVAAGLSRDT